MKTLRLIRPQISALILVLLVIPTALARLPQPEAAAAPEAMVASQHPIASRIGTEILKKGGNAVDAAIAVGFALAVVYPEAGNIGGGGFLLLRLADGRTSAIDYREKAPGGATRDMYLDEEGNLIKGDGGSVFGYRASGVPGTVAGFELAYKKYGSGKLKWSELVEPARRIADKGFELSYRQARLFISYKAGLEKYTDSKRIFLNGGNHFKAGDILVQKDLARTLSRIRDSGAEDFYKGETARLIAKDMARNNGLITLEDLANYEAVERQPLVGTYRGQKVISMPPPSSGGIVVIQVLNMLERYDLASLEHNSAAKNHLVIEAMKRAFADRAELMGDPDFSHVPTDRLISKEYAEERGKGISASKAARSADLGAGLPPGPEPEDTTHFTIIDKDGSVVSNTYTINNIYGSAVTASGTGILLNDEMDDFAAQPGKPNMFGLIQGEKNAVGPGKRPLSSMTPTIVLDREGKVWFAVGARGGPMIIGAVLHTVINMVDYKMNIQQALDSPRIYHQWLPDQVIYEPYGLSPDSRAILEDSGHIFSATPRTLGSATAIAVGSGGVRYGAIDARSDGSAIGY